MLHLARRETQAGMGDVPPCPRGAGVATCIPRAAHVRRTRDARSAQLSCGRTVATAARPVARSPRSPTGRTRADFGAPPRRPDTCCGLQTLRERRRGAHLSACVERGGFMHAVGAGTQLNSRFIRGRRTPLLDFTSPTVAAPPWTGGGMWRLSSSGTAQHSACLRHGYTCGYHTLGID